MELPRIALSVGGAPGLINRNAIAGVERDHIAGPSRFATDRVRRGLYGYADSITQGRRAGNVGADVVALNNIPGRKATVNKHSVPGISGNEVAISCGCPTNHVVRRIPNFDPVVAISDRDGAADIGTDILANN